MHVVNATMHVVNATMHAVNATMHAYIFELKSVHVETTSGIC